ncbi:hypothetical protein GT045_09905 [Streptomyces sp. SID486]|uniref:hypothetical protein n=1 Tax=unclassified Streptomyces TaxID=2593676 RepID=UPI00136898E4|nr:MULTISPECIES: hypothetical protein [unclassified Streptomyces]MYW19371.1 hypothetical protein [Streptomyces sp. SID2955]MYW46509.1 hypothetical protein [Streptomyces sp. SID161]MYX95119.1 hypothetical protein [Streptomyces sp. SID486]
MNKGLRTAAAAAALVTGLVTAAGAPAAAAGRSERITSQEQLAANIAKAVAAEQHNGAVTDGVVGGIVANTGKSVVRPAAC